ncbi:MAG: uroporphyrinogen decarboxylase [Chloroflexi bacterium]|jgi:uroporphyrinogen decarboxylase|nr:uroporphyrinogen decarboxylase [Chloroflexota bacterium]
MTAINGRHVLFGTLKGKPENRLPWVPLAGVHAGKLMGYSAREVLNDGDKLVRSLLAVYQQYSPDGMPVYFDIQVEAEILGCELVWTDDAPPSVVSHPLAELKSIPEKIPASEEGRLALILNVMHRIKQEIGNQVGLFGLVTGPLTLAYHLRGQQLFFDINDNPDFLQALLNYTVQVAQAITNYYVDAGMDTIGIIEPVASQISPETYAAFLLQKHTALFQHIRGMGVYSMLHICGNATKLIDLVCSSGTDIFSIDEHVDLRAIKPIMDRHNITLQGNLPTASLLLLGSPQENRDYVSNLLNSLPNHRNLILSPGCDLPYDTPIENINAVIEVVRNHRFVSSGN